MACTIKARSRVGCSTERRGGGEWEEREGGVAQREGEEGDGGGEEVLKKRTWPKTEKRERESSFPFSFCVCVCNNCTVSPLSDKLYKPYPSICRHTHDLTAQILHPRQRRLKATAWTHAEWPYKTRAYVGFGSGELILEELQLCHRQKLSLVHDWLAQQHACRNISRELGGVSEKCCTRTQKSLRSGWQRT